MGSSQDVYWKNTASPGIPLVNCSKPRPRGAQELLAQLPEAGWKKVADSVVDTLLSRYLTAFVFPERRFVAGFFRRLLAYLTPDISHTYPSHHTYPTHIRSKRIPPIRIRSTRIPPVRIHSMRIHSKGITPHISHTYPFKTYPTKTYPFNTYPTSTYPFNAYPFKRFASAGFAPISIQNVSHQYVSMLCVSIQCVSIQKVCISRNRKRIPPIHIPPIRIRSTRMPPVRIRSMRIHAKSLHQQEWQWVWVSLHVISYHCYSAGMVMKIETLLFLQFLCNFINWI